MEVRILNKLIWLGALLCTLPLSSTTHAAPYPVIAQDVGVCDPNSPTHCVAPNSSGQLPVVVAGSTGTSDVNLKSIGDTQTVTGGVNGSLGVGGLAADGVTAIGNPILVGGTSDGTSVGSVSVARVYGAGQLSISFDQINNAAPSLTNPIWVANAETADVTGTFTNGTQTTSITNSAADGYAAGLISINGTYATASGVFEESDDSSTTWYSVICSRSDGTASETGYTSLTNTNRQWSCPVGGNDSLRVRSTAVATGTVNVRVGVSAPPPSTDSVSGTVTAVGAAATNTTAVGNPVQDGCVYNSTPLVLSNGQVAPLPCTVSGWGLVNIAGIGNNNITGLANGGNLTYQGGSGAVFTSPHPLGVTPYYSNGTSMDAPTTIIGSTAAAATGVGTTAVEQTGTSFNEITTATTTTVKSGATILHSVCVNTPIASATVKVYNALTATGTPFTLTIPSTITGESPFCMKYDVYFGTGITVVTSGVTDVTVIYGR